MHKIIIDHFSLSAFPLYMKYNSTDLGHGTAFFYEANNETYLVTNWHNLAGVNPENGKCLSTTGGLPNKISFPVHIRNKLGTYDTCKCDLFSIDNTPLWRQHQRYGPKVDIAVINIRIPEKFVAYPINKILQRDNIRPQIASDVYILGFPKRQFTNIIPIWKRASIASEYDISVDDLPQFLVDTATYRGMSGSPVIIRANQFTESDTGTVMCSTLQTGFLGIYSGRYPADEDRDVQLGRVWKKELLDEIIAEGVPGNRSL